MDWHERAKVPSVLTARRSESSLRPIRSRGLDCPKGNEDDPGLWHSDMQGRKELSAVLLVAGISLQRAEELAKAKIKLESFKMSRPESCFGFEAFRLIGLRRLTRRPRKFVKQMDLERSDALNQPT